MLKFMARWWLIGAVFLLMTASGCSGCNNDTIDTIESGAISVSPNPIAFAQVNVNDTSSINARVRNLSSDPLTIYEVRLEPDEGASVDAIRLTLPQTPFEVPGNGETPFTVTFAPTSTARTSGKLRFISSDPNWSREVPYSVDVSTIESAPRLEPTPRVVRFARRSITQDPARQTVTLRNLGTAELIIYEAPAYSGGTDFTLTSPSRAFPLTLKPYNEQLALSSPADYELPLEVVYRPLGANADSGTLRIISNDLRTPAPGDDARGVTTIDVRANADAACIIVDDLVKNFGQVPVLQSARQLLVIESCGTEDLSLSAIRITTNSGDQEYELDLASLDIDGNGELDEPLVLRPGQTYQLPIDYIPLGEGTDRGTLTLYSNDPVQPELEVSLVARGSEGQCPTAKLSARVRSAGAIPSQTIATAPLQYVILDARDSEDEDGQVVDWRWEVIKAPDDFVIDRTLAANPTQEDPGNEDTSRREIRLLLAGSYEIGVKAVDNEGFESCNQATVRIVATPNEKILVELTWTNPEDNDELDKIGADVDLHFAKMGPGVWFQAPYDIYYLNTNSGAGSENNGLWNPESPSLDIDDTDGGGPENVQLNDPDDCQWYAIGAHYFSQRFGTAYATVRIYINGAEVYSSLNKPLTDGGQFWDVARIHWPSGQIYEVDQILPATPIDQAPQTTDAMRASGQCTAAMLY